MIKFQAISKWIAVSPTQIAMELSRLYKLDSCVDATGQNAAALLNTPNALVIEGLISDEGYAKMEAEMPDAILWSEVTDET
jgi:hypothetical protein